MHKYGGPFATFLGMDYFEELKISLFSRTVFLRLGRQTRIMDHEGNILAGRNLLTDLSHPQALVVQKIIYPYGRTTPLRKRAWDTPGAAQ